MEKNSEFGNYQRAEYSHVEESSAKKPRIKMQNGWEDDSDKPWIRVSLDEFLAVLSPSVPVTQRPRIRCQVSNHLRLLGCFDDDRYRVRASIWCFHRSASEKDKHK